MPDQKTNARGTLLHILKTKRNYQKDIFECFSEEKVSAEPNFALIRKYFKKANQNLKALLLYGLYYYPERIDLLSDLAFFHQFENILSILISYYTRACIDQENIEKFTELSKEFYYVTIADGYEALYALRELFETDTDKRKIIEFLISEEEENKHSQPIEF